MLFFLIFGALGSKEIKAKKTDELSVVNENILWLIVKYLNHLEAVRMTCLCQKMHSSLDKKIHPNIIKDHRARKLEPENIYSWDQSAKFLNGQSDCYIMESIYDGTDMNPAKKPKERTSLPLEHWIVKYLKYKDKDYKRDKRTLLFNFDQGYLYYFDDWNKHYYELVCFPLSLNQKYDCNEKRYSVDVRKYKLQLQFIKPTYHIELRFFTSSSFIVFSPTYFRTSKNFRHEKEEKENNANEINPLKRKYDHTTKD
jgi:hypothetical protein